MPVDLIIRNIGELVYFKEEGLEIIEKASVAVSEGKIVAVGPEKTVLDSIEVSESTTFIDAHGHSVIPAFVDPHTHLIYGGCRHEEFLARLKGKEYLELMKEGKGINYTVSLTRKESIESLKESSLTRLQQMIANGILTVEIKSGYGLNLETEKKILQVADTLKDPSQIDIVTTFLGAHAIPTEFAGNRREYINLLTEIMIPELREYAQFIDIFIDKGAFTVDEAREIFRCAEKYNYDLKMHIDELSYTGAAKLANEFEITSAEHLEYTSEQDLEIFKERNVTPVLLPGTYFFLKSQKKPAVEVMRELNLPVALGTDHNPGTSPLYSQSLVMALAVFLYDMGIEEALRGATWNAARALKLHHKKGNIAVGMDADMLILSTHSFVHLVYEIGNNQIETLIKKGKPLSIRSI